MSVLASAAMKPVAPWVRPRDGPKVAATSVLASGAVKPVAPWVRPRVNVPAPVSKVVLDRVARWDLPGIVRVAQDPIAAASRATELVRPRVIPAAPVFKVVPDPVSQAVPAPISKVVLDRVARWDLPGIVPVDLDRIAAESRATELVRPRVIPAAPVFKVVPDPVFKVVPAPVSKVVLDRVARWDLPGIVPVDPDPIAAESRGTELVRPRVTAIGPVFQAVPAPVSKVVLGRVARWDLPGIVPEDPDPIAAESRGTELVRPREIPADLEIATRMMMSK